jgi:hypothetical protein
VLRGLVERDRALLGVVARIVYEATGRVLRLAGEEAASKTSAPPRTAVPGMVASIQTFGSYANFHPHIHAIVAEGVFALDGTFHAIPCPPAWVFEEVFRRLLLAAFVRAERLSEEFADRLLAWHHSGFSVYVGTRIEAHDRERLERLGRYVTRPALPTDAVKLRDDGRVEITTKPDPKTGSKSLELDPLDFVHAVVTQIPDAKKHLVRYYGGYSHRMRATVRAKHAVAGAATGEGGEPAGTSGTPPEPVTHAERGSPEARRRSAWRRLLSKHFEVDPLLCPKCKTQMKVVAFITERATIDRILAHRDEAGLVSPFEARGPPPTG